MGRDEMLQDLAYARAMAEEGRHTPLLGGPYLIFWGALNAIAFSAQWGLLTGRLPAAAGASYAALWIGYGLIAAVVMAALGFRTRAKPGLASIGVRAERAVWLGAATAIGAIAVGSIVRMMLEQNASAPNAIMGAAFGLYGAALYATAQLSGHGWLRGFGWLAAIVAGALCVFANQHWAYLIAAAGSVLVLLLPGAVLLRREPSAIV